MFFGGRDTGIWLITSGRDDANNLLEGWFDIESGYFSGLVWESVSRLFIAWDGYVDNFSLTEHLMAWIL